MWCLFNLFFRVYYSINYLLLYEELFAMELEIT